MTKIFISYRRSDTQYQVDDLYEIFLKNKVSRNNIFKDIESIEVGQNYEQAIDNAIEESAFCLVAIGPNWINTENKERLHNEGDYVRREIAKALKNNNIIVVPVLFDAEMPKADDLPEDIKELSLRNSFNVSRTHKEDDIKNLVQKLGIKTGNSDEKRTGLKLFMRWINIAAIVFVALVVMAILVPVMLKSVEKAKIKPEIYVDAALYNERTNSLILFSGDSCIDFSISDATFSMWNNYYFPDSNHVTYYNAAVEWPEKYNAMYMFHEAEYYKWYITDDSYAAGFPKTIANNWSLPETGWFDAAMYYQKNIYFFINDSVLEYSSTKEATTGKVNSIKDKYPNLEWTNYIDAACAIGYTGKALFFIDNMYILYDLKNNIQISPSLMPTNNIESDTDILELKENKNVTVNFE